MAGYRIGDTGNLDTDSGTVDTDMGDSIVDSDMGGEPDLDDESRDFSTPAEPQDGLADSSEPAAPPEAPPAPAPPIEPVSTPEENPTIHPHPNPEIEPGPEGEPLWNPGRGPEG